MKLNLLLLAAYSAAPSHPAASAYLHHPRHPSPALLLRGDRSSRAPDRRHHHRRRSTTTTTTATTRLRYKEQPNTGSDSSEPSNGGGGGGGSGESNGANVWSVLASTERWISDTLDRSNQAEVTRQKQQQQQQQSNKKDSKLHFADEKADGEQQHLGGKDNPYARKEVSYVCETAADVSAVVGGVFRRVREARELGESHGRAVEARLGTTTTMTTDASQPATMRQTNVVVIPNCDELSTFQTFDGLVQAINQARRAARDFVIKNKDGDDGGKDWV
jgi:hypothetical protein